MNTNERKDSTSESSDSLDNPFDVSYLNISITDAALEFLSKLIENYEVEGTACRIFIERAGTKDAETFLAYHPPESLVQDDLYIDYPKFRLYIDNLSKSYLKDTKVDFNLEQEQLTIASPYAKVSSSDSQDSLYKKSKAHRFAHLQGKTFTTEGECKSHLVPSGIETIIPKDSQVQVTQALGASFTLYFNGNLVRINKSQTYLLGIDLEELNDNEKEYTNINEEIVLDSLKQCFDPEIPVNIVDMGLIYDCVVTPVSDSNEKNKENNNGEKKNKYDVFILMTLTAPGCGMGDIIMLDVKDTVESLTNVNNVNIEMTFDPPWDTSRMTDSAKLHLGLL